MIEEEFQKYIENSPKVKTVIHWWNLYNGHYVRLEPELQKQIFQEAIDKSGSYSSLGRTLNIYRKTLSNCSKIIHRPNILLLKRICDYIDFPKHEMERNIINIGKSYFRPILPFKLHNESGAEIRAAFLSDGHIPYHPTKSVLYMAYEIELHRRLVKLCKEIFGDFNTNTKFNRRTYVTRFPSVIGTALELAGVIRSDKRLVKCFVPRDILTGIEKIQCAYLRRVFDDEGDVCFDIHGKRAVRITRSFDITNENINIPSLKRQKWTFLKNLNPSVNNLILGERFLLQKIGIDAKLYKEGIYKSLNNRITSKWRIQIGQQDSLKKFSSTIGFNLNEKQEKLQKALNSYKRRKLPNGEGKNITIKLARGFYNKQKYFRYKDLANTSIKNGFCYDYAGHYLRTLLKENIIRKVKRGFYVFR